MVVRICPANEAMKARLDGAVVLLRCLTDATLSFIAPVQARNVIVETRNYFDENVKIAFTFFDADFGALPLSLYFAEVFESDKSGKREVLASVTEYIHRRERIAFEKKAFLHVLIGTIIHSFRMR